MSENNVFLFFLIAHFLINAAWFWISKIPKKEKIVFLPLTLLLPVMGVLCAYISIRPNRNARMTPVSELYNSVSGDMNTILSKQAEISSVAPVEEIMTLNDGTTRYEVIKHMLYNDPFRYLENFRAACSSSDADITHYAVTTIIEIQKEFDEQIKAADEELSNNPENLPVLDNMISIIASYIDAGLLKGGVLKNLQGKLSAMLEYKITVAPDIKSSYHCLIENETDLGNYKRAGKIKNEALKKWPNDEDFWLDALYLCMLKGDAREKKRLIKKMVSGAGSIQWSRKGYEEVKFLCGDDIKK